MAQRRFGPTLGAGVVVIEKEAQKPISPAPLGVTCFFGAFEKGDLDKLIPTNGARDSFRKMGSRLSDLALLAPDAMEDFWEHSNGAGELYVIRITDGFGRKAERTFFNRSTSGNAARVLKVTAHNVGRWAGRHNRLVGAVTAGGDITETTLTTGKTMLKDEWKGGYIVLDECPTYSFKIVSNTTAGVVTVESDSTMKTLWTAGGGVLLGYLLKLDNEGKALSVKILPTGEDDPANEYGIECYVDGRLVKTFKNLNSATGSKNDVEKVINEDGDNWEILVDQLWTGGFTPSTRPANAIGRVKTAAANLLTVGVNQRTISSPTGANPAVTYGTSTDDMPADRLVGTVSGVGTKIDWVSDKFGALLPQATIGVAWVPDSPYVQGNTVTNGATVLVDGDTITIDFNPLDVDALIGHEIYPNYVDSPKLAYRVTDNAHDTITVDPSVDLSLVTAGGKVFLGAYPAELEGGYDGVESLADANYISAMNPATTLIKQFAGKNKGLVKLAAPGNAATAVQKAGAALAEAFGYEWRYDLTSTLASEDTAIAQVDDTLGRNDFAVAAFPSFAKVHVPELTGLKLISMTGAICGREALMAKNYDGYHKAASGIDVTFPRVVEIPTGDTVLNEEKLNPRGIAVIKKNKGNFILWGDRTVSLDPSWKWKHQREQMSHYEHVLIENFDWIIFAINDPIEQISALTTLKSFFLPEWKPKRALRGKTFEEAAAIKIDAENNTDLTMAAGDMNAEVILKLADTIERFRITIGPAGIFESAA